MPVRTLLLALLLAGPLAAERLLAQSPPGADETIATAPVEVDGEVLFNVRGTSSFPAAERARAIRQRIIAAAADPSVPLLSVAAVDRDDVVRIVAGERLLVTVVDADGALEGLSRNNLASAH